MSSIGDLDPAPYALPAELEGRLLTPALVIHLERVRGNVRAIVSMLDGDVDRWRPHVKSTKTPEVWVELCRAGVRHFKCATTREAELLCATLEREKVAGGDVLVAYPHLGPALARLETIAAAYRSVQLSVLVEATETVVHVPAELGLFVDVDPGMGRTGVPRDDEALLVAVARAAGERFRGVHYYDGHRTDPDREVRRVRAHEDYDVLVSLLDVLDREGLHAGEAITSGTPSFEAALAYAPFAELGGTTHRVSPGTVVFHDARSEQQNPSLGLTPAAVVMSRVVSRPTANVATLDAGSKAVGADAGDPCAVAIGRPELAALTPSEEHLPMRVERGEGPERGALVALVPRHVCTTTNLHECAVIVDEGRLVGIVPVAARGHELERER